MGCTECCAKREHQATGATPFIYLFFKFLLIYLFNRKRKRRGGAEGEEEAVSPMSRDPNAGPDPRTMT